MAGSLGWGCLKKLVPRSLCSFFGHSLCRSHTICKPSVTWCCSLCARRGARLYDLTLALTLIKSKRDILFPYGSPSPRPHPTLGITAACYRTEKARIPKGAGESAGKSAGKKGTAGGIAGSSAVSLLFHRNGCSQHCSQQSPQQSPFPGTLPSTLPGTFGDSGFLSPVAGGHDSYPTPRNGPETDPKRTRNGAKRTRNGPKRSRNGPKSSPL